MLDGDGDGRATPAELRAAARGASRAALALARAALLAARAALAAALAPAATLALDVKARLVGGRTSGLSEADAVCLAGAIAGGPAALGF